MILLFSNPKSERAEALRQMLYFIGIITVSAPSLHSLPFPAEKFSAVLIVDAPQDDELLALTKAFHDRLFCLGDAPIGEAVPLKLGAYASEIVSEIRSHLISSGQRPSGEYKLFALDASYDRDGVYFGQKRISFTRTEAMLLRSLIALYPIPLTQDELLASAFRAARIPEASNIRTHICVMNKKFRILTARQLIASAEHSEYSLLSLKE